MKDTFEIIWSKRAYKNLAKIIDYLEQNWTEKEIFNFSSELDRCIEIIRKSPETFPKSSKKPSLRKVVVTKHNTLYYKVEGKLIKLIVIFDTRQDPKKLENSIINTSVNEPTIEYGVKKDNSKS